jgi:phosphoribosylanthranilate isomerase
VDAYLPGLYGGTGVTGDWALAGGLAGRYPILLAGGLHPGNAAQAVEQANPWGVDVASSVESAPGRKDPQKMRDFIRAVKNLSQEATSC